MRLSEIQTHLSNFCAHLIYDREFNRFPCTIFTTFFYFTAFSVRSYEERANQIQFMRDFDNKIVFNVKKLSKLSNKLVTTFNA